MRALLLAACCTLAAGSTRLLIGQTFEAEFSAYVQGFGVAPSGSSHYGEVWTGTLDQGDDGKNGDNSAPYLAYIAKTYPQATAVVGISIKDNPGAGGYPNVPEAVKAIAYTSKWDANIAKFAATFKRFPTVTFLVRLGYEVSQNMFGDVQAYHDCFNKMARIIRDDNNATNTRFVYHPVRGYNDVVSMYPGPKYTDYIGFSVFNNDLAVATDEANPTCRGLGLDGARIDSNLQKGLDWARNVAQKPIVIPESAYQKAPEGWIQKVPNTTRTDAFQEYLDRLTYVATKYDVSAWSYINSNWPAHGWGVPWTDSRVEVHQVAYWKERVLQNRQFVQYPQA